MAKEVTKENLKQYAEESLSNTATAVEEGLMDKKTADGHVREIFYLSGTFGLGLQEDVRAFIESHK